MTTNRPTQIGTLVTGVLLVLTACGGGGGDSPGNEVSAAPTLPPLQSGQPQPVATREVLRYEDGTPQRAVFDAINTARTQCGWGALTRNLKLDQAAQGQADYETARWNEGNGHQFVTLRPHEQVESLSGYTGATYWSRLANYQYAFADGTTELSSRQALLQLPAFETERAIHLLQRLLTTVYHLAGLVGSGIEIGIGYQVATTAPTTLTNNPMATLVVAIGQPTGEVKRPQEAALITWPCHGSRTNASWSNPEWPDPLARSVGWSQPIGPPIFLRSRSGSRLAISSIVLSGYSAETFILSADNDPHQRLRSNEAFVLMKSPLTPGQSYTASIAGTIDSTPFTHQFTFSTK